jgi:hypothetical protein
MIETHVKWLPSDMASPFPTVLIRQALCCGSGKQIHSGEADPNGSEVGNKFDLYVQVNPNGTALVWVKTTDGGNTGWI